MDRILAFDTSLSQQLSLSKDSGWWRWVRILAHLGDGPYVFGGLGVLYLSGWLWDVISLRQATSTIAIAVLTTMIIITSIKYMVRRERPNPPGEFVTFQYDAYSFPSGHAARLSALAASTIAFWPGLGWGLLIFALSVAVARVAIGIHYLIDIMVGLIVGAIVAQEVILLLT
jgi:undecaprenyl-diphosphatase